MPKTCKRQLYFAYIIYTKILYVLEVYGHTSRGNINKIQVLQNKCLKTLYQKDWFTHTNDLHKELNVLKVEDIFKHSMAQLVYKQRNNLLHDVFDSYFKPRNEMHNLQAHNAHKFNVIRVKNNYGKSSLKYKGAKIYNELPNDIMYCKSLNIFKNRTKKYYKSLYI